MQRRPHDPTAHTIMANAVILGGGDPIPLMNDVLPFALADAPPARAELLRLTWWALLYGSRQLQGAPMIELAAERAALLHFIRTYQPADEEEEIRIRLLETTILIADSSGEDILVFAPPRDLVDTNDPVVLFLLLRETKKGNALRPVLIDRLLRSDPSNPRYSNYLLAAALESENQSSALRELITEGLPDPRFDDHAWIYLVTSDFKESDPDALGWYARRKLEEIADGPAKRTATEIAVLFLVREDARTSRFERALRRIDEFEERFGRANRRLSVERARVFEKMGRPLDAALSLLIALGAGDQNLENWYSAARNMQKADRIPEAVRLYQFYLLQMDRRARGEIPYGATVDAKRRVASHARVWGRYAEVQPSFVTRSATRHLLELLALTAAGLLAAARFRRARAFLLPALLGAEITFFAGLIALRLEETSLGIVSLLWLLSAAGRAFVLVGGGLYLSAMAGLPRRATAPRVVLVAAVAVALAAGWLVGFPPPPLYLLADVPLAARVGELGVSATVPMEGAAAIVSLVRSEAAARLVWPALVASALHARGLGARGVFAVALAAAVTATGSQVAWPIAFATAGALVVARLKGGALAPFVLHAAFVAGGVAALAVRP